MKVPGLAKDNFACLEVLELTPEQYPYLAPYGKLLAEEVKEEPKVEKKPKPIEPVEPEKDEEEEEYQEIERIKEFTETPKVTEKATESPKNKMITPPKKKAKK